MPTRFFLTKKRGTSMISLDMIHIRDMGAEQQLEQGKIPMVISLIKAVHLHGHIRLQVVVVRLKGSTLEDFLIPLRFLNSFLAVVLEGINTEDLLIKFL